MLGSVPEESAVMGYLEKFLQSSESLTQREGDCYFFIACGSQDENIVKGSKKLKKNSLYQKVLDRISKEKNLNKKIRIEPFIGQRVFSIFGRSDLYITRSGGLTSAEIIKLKGRFKEGETHRDPKKVCIHSSAKGANASKEALLEAIPLWENGNAGYLVEYYDAEIINTESLNIFNKLTAPS